MNSKELMLAATGQVAVRKADRQLVQQAKKVADEVMLAKLKTDGKGAVTASIMDDVLALENRRRSMQTGDPITDMLMAKVVVGFVDDAMAIRANLYKEDF